MKEKQKVKKVKWHLHAMSQLSLKSQQRRRLEDLRCVKIYCSVTWCLI